MKIEILSITPDAEKLIEEAGRTCYKSENRITAESARAFVAGIIKSGHHSVIEHESMSVRFVVDRGVSHEIVRHRIASFSQESTRYCNYSKSRFGSELTFISPRLHVSKGVYDLWCGGFGFRIGRRGWWGGFVGG